MLSASPLTFSIAQRCVSSFLQLVVTVGLHCFIVARACGGLREFLGVRTRLLVSVAIMTTRARLDVEAGGHGEDASVDMDPRLWGALRKYIDLKIIYNKLPMEEFFRLRQVCKDWNRLASDRGFLEESFKDPIPKPYFFVDSGKMGHRLFTRDASTRRWTWTRLPPAKCAVSGLLVDYSDNGSNNFVFNLHTRVFHALPPAPALPGEDEVFEEPLVGLTVDTSVSPYSFKVYLGHEEIATRIYDSKSNSWTQKKSHNVCAGNALESENVQKPYCFYCNGILYFRVWMVYKPMIDCQSYNLEKDEWDNGNPPIDDEVWAFCDMGVWQDRVFVVRMSPEANAAIEVYGVVDDDPDFSNDPDFSKMTRESFMSGTLKTWMLAGQEDKVERFGEEIEIQGVFCDEHLLVYNCSGVDEVTERAVLYNLESKTWEKLELPPSWPRVVKKDEGGGEEDEDGEEEYEEGEEGVEDYEEGLDEDEEVEEEEGKEEVEDEEEDEGEVEEE